MFKFSVVMSVYNVDKYINEAVQSIVKQKLSFKDNIEIIFIDDGSTDKSSEICKKWQKKYPNNIKYVYKQNGGLSSARNEGIKHASGEWITFIDPDDFINDIYFKKINDTHNKHPEADILIGKLVFYFEGRKKKNRVSDSHPLKNQINDMHGKSPLIDFSSPKCTFKQASVAFAFYRLNIILKNNLTFKENIKCGFEDAHFVARYIFYSSQKAAVSPYSIYYYRKRVNKSSLSDNTWNKREAYTDDLDFMDLDLIEFYVSKIGYIPNWLQCFFIYRISWYINIITFHNNYVSKNNLFNDFLGKVKKIFSYIDEELLRYHPNRVLYRDLELGIFNIFYDKKDTIFNNHINISKYNKQKNYIKLSIFSSSENLNLSFVADDITLLIRTHKIKTIKFQEMDFYYEHIFYLDTEKLNNNDIIKAFLDNNEVKISWYANKCSLLPRFSLKGIEAAFTKKDVLNLTFKNLFRKAFFINRLSQINYIKNKYQDSWLLIDRDYAADDNAEHFYRYLKNNTKENIYFLIKKGTKDYNRLKKEGFNIISFSSLQHKIALLNAKYVISSQADDYAHSFLKGKYYKNSLKYEFIFLQHGVTKDDQSAWLNNEPIDIFITSTKREYDSIVFNNNAYKYSKEEVILTGFPRHDSLLYKDKKCEREKKSIVIMPTWRSSIAGPHLKNTNKRYFYKEHLKSDYVKEWSKLLLSKELQNIKDKYNLNIIFYPHINMEYYTNNFRLFDGIKYFDSSSNIGIQDLLVQGDIFITDYSSVAFESAYICKNILYYQYDKDDVFNNDKHYSKKGYFDYDVDGFGKVCLDQQSLINSIQKIIDNDFVVEEKYLKRMQEFFMFKDGKCSERIYQHLIK